MTRAGHRPTPHSATTAPRRRRWIATGLALVLGLAAAATALPTARSGHAPVATATVAAQPLPHLARQLARGASLRIVAFGSSSTEGVGASSPAAAYPARLEAALRQALPHLAEGIAVLNRGVGGEHTDDMLARLDRDVLAAKPDLVIWQTGSNDPLRGVSLAHFRAATLAGLARMRDAGSDVVLMEPQWCPKLDATPGADRFRDAVRAIGAELGIPVIRRAELMRDWIAEGKATRETLFAPDGLHMADRGYDLLARAVARDLLHRARPAPALVAAAGE
ncbi:lipolytic protein G-D-S-L family [Methylobacterium sp. 4-46]|uniref:SGNH/GDSL hydrolase family protein n=1 Tax=unclassified Methylobacterium TaxID=2615210 RepID=UPI000152E6B0|nr:MULTISPECIES: SGNH/GDSL hydrolase family protein [Methylobacterium]ACA16553.1 lipolytic protein G-D-S-L family [Methylobacterium sp. 4-46]WFT82262.1 SGNH/GDSL hydrolase family protein [Methylobacterium nodulans]